jgi:hypothetical protein
MIDEVQDIHRTIIDQTDKHRHSQGDVEMLSIEEEKKSSIYILLTSTTNCLQIQ